MASAELAKSREALFRAVFEQSRDAIFVLDRSGYLECNQAGLDLFGLASLPELRALTIGDASPPTQPDGTNSMTAAQARIEAAYRDGRQFFEWQLRRVDGTLFWAEVSLSRIEISGSEYLHAILHDITERRHAEDEMRKSRALLSRVMEGSNDGFWELHVPTNKLVLSERWASMLGYRLDDIEQTHEMFMSLLHPKDADRLMQLRNACLAARTPGYQAEFRLRAKSGEWHWVLSRGKVSSWLAPGQAEWLSGTHVDIHSCKRAEQMLATQYAVTEIYTAAEAFEPAIEAILRTLCELLDASVGTLWLPVMGEENLRCSGIWHDPDVPMGELMNQTAAMQFSKGEGLPGRIWKSGRSDWFSLDAAGLTIRRAPYAVAAGMKTGMGFPLRIGDTVEGVFEFFSREICTRDELLSATLLRIGEQIALFLRQKRSERRMLGMNAELEARVAARTRELQCHRDSLESTIAQRTKELRENNVRLYAEVVDRRRSEDELRKLTWAVENSPTMVIITDALGHIEYVNPRFVQITGYAEKEVMGRSPRLLKSNTHPTDFYENLWKTISAGKVWHGDFLNKRKNGELYWQASTISPIHNAAGTITHYVAVMDDVTERKHAAEEMQRAKDSAEAASRAKSEFLATISHEIRTPMNAIIGLNHLLKTTRLSGRQRNFVVNVEAAAQSLMDVINDILDFSKIESGKFDMQSVEFSLDAVMSKLAQVMASEAQQKALEFTITIAKDIPQVLQGDPQRLGQVLLNLTSNAVKFTPKGSVRVAADLVRLEDGIAELRFTVSDTGIGIDEKLRAKLFVPFKQVDSSTSRRYGGTGLGLVISRRFVELMNGTIDVKSKLGEGTTVVFTVQLTDTGKKSWQFHPQLPPMMGRRALVSDKNETSRGALQSLLAGFSFDVVCVPSGAGLIEEIRRGFAAGAQGYDLVFLCESLIDINWRDAVEQIRGLDGAAKNVPIVLIATQDSETLRTSAGDAQLDGFLLKPYTRSTLYDVMLHALSSAASMTDDIPQSDLAVPDARQILRGTHILLVEDNEINQLVAVETLGLAGSEVSVATGGADCLRKLADPNSHRIYDLVLMDLQMPEMDGIQATRRIRQDPRFGRIPIIAMTADVVQGVREKCLAAGMNDYLSKPIQPEELYGKVAMWIQAAKQTPPDRTSVRRPATGAQKIIPPAQAISKSGKHAALSKKNVHIDADAGIARVAGNVSLYERLLGQFYDKFSHADTEIDALLKRGQRADAVRIAHTVKGVSGNLGVTQLHEIAAAWERCLNDGKESDKAVDARFRTVLKESMAAVAKMCPATAIKETIPTPADLPAETVSPGAISEGAKAGMLRLATALESNDLEATALVKSIGPQLDGFNAGAELAAIQESIQHFDFVNAHAILKRLMKRLDLSRDAK